jgi:hypothetical protein
MRKCGILYWLNFTKETKMTVIEQKFMEIVPHRLAEIERQIKVLNQLKGLEIKAMCDKSSITPEMVDDILEG